MMDILLVGATGAMGNVLAELIKDRKDMRIVAGVSAEQKDMGFPIYTDFSSISQQANMIIDFSNASVTPHLLAYIEQTKIPAVIATTGLSEEIREKIRQLSQESPIFYTQNMSLGVNVMSEALKFLTKALTDFDIEIIEAHHNQKVDAPSGTAELLFHSIQEIKADASAIYDRSQLRHKRNSNEIGIASLRGGTIVGEHSVLFCGTDEIIEIKHSAGSKKIFANGALRAAEFLIQKNVGLYDMKDVIL